MRVAIHALPLTTEAPLLLVSVKIREKYMPAEMSYCEVYLIPRSVTTFGWVSLRLSSSRASWNGIKNFAHQPAFSFHRIDGTFPAVEPVRRPFSVFAGWTLVSRSQGQELMRAQSGCVRQAYGKRGAIGQIACR